MRIAVDFACTRAAPNRFAKVGQHPGAYHVVAETPDGKAYRHNMVFTSGDARAHRLIVRVEDRGYIESEHWTPCSR